MKKTLTALISVAVVAHAPLVYAHETNENFLSKPTEADLGAAQLQVGKVIQRLESNDPEGAVDIAFSGNPLIKSQKMQMTNLVTQIAGALSIYGNITKCSPVRWSHYGSHLIKLEYTCLHESQITQWNFNMMKLNGAWSINSLRFQDASI